MNKKPLLIVLFVFVITGKVQPQTNTFPASGTVGIGTLSPNPDVHLDIYDGNFGKLKVGLVTYVGSTRTSNTANAVFGRNVYTKDLDNVRIMTTSNYGIGAQYMVMSNNNISFHIIQGNTVKDDMANNPVVVFRQRGIGIGTSSPAGSFEILKDPTLAESEIYLTGQSGANQNSNSLRLNSVGYAQKAGFAIQAINVSHYGGKDLVFYAHNANDYTTYNEVVRFRYDGKVGIGTADPQAKLDVNGNIYSSGKVFIGTADGSTATKIAPYALAVDGSAIFTRATVKLSGAWPDYVFKPGYRQPSVDSLERYIRLHGHLPEVPQAAEVEANGIDLGETQALLLKKIEELTLMVIEQEKKMKLMKKTVEELQLRIKSGRPVRNRDTTL